ncbi:carbon-nitrogen hydrolase family protein [Actinocorallia sp. A-T 12471]|uniref:carbon-nitrogen hydrolase family protein n=1 Tax=Actinocorallia sp. A-T 12471 TaxID=3089813 RepID=UPI0029D12E6A|nr:carbon-nitrogen hydrolase family protein [Actinocorallia sp. A-T 12471]MDX6743906.1 carbon-nitrogen hydrolase family protein [Actinocorallia sp. A-T 12471]
METLRVGLAQITALPGDVTGNAHAAAQTVKEAADAGAALAVFPELSLIGYDLALLADPTLVITADDARLDPVREAARETGVTAVVSGAYRHPGGGLWIAALAAKPDGTLLPQGKRHLHGPERDVFDPAPQGPLLDVHGWRVALAVCYDAGVPAHAADAARQGAEVYAASVLYDRAEERRFDVHLASRAMDHRMYAVAANYAGGPGAGLGPGWESCGGSGAWAPDGRRLTAAGAAPALVIADLDRAPLDALRAKDADAGYPRGTA